MILRYRKSMITTFETVPYSYKNTQCGRFRALPQTTHGGGGERTTIRKYTIVNLDLYYLRSRTPGKLRSRGFQVLLDTGNNFTSGADHARRCLQSQNSILKMLKKFNFKFIDKIYLLLNNLFQEGGSKLIPEAILQSSSRPTEKPLGWTMSDAVFQFKNFNFSFFLKI